MMLGSSSLALATLSNGLAADERASEPVDLTEGLVDWWMSEVSSADPGPAFILDFGDGIGGGNNLPLTNSGTTVPIVGGKWLFASLFDGGDFLTRPDESLLRLGETDVTFALWLKPTAYGGVAFENNGSFYFGHIGSTQQFEFLIWKNNLRWRAISTFLPLNSWTLAILEWDANQERIGIKFQGNAMVRYDTYAQQVAPAAGSMLVGRNYRGSLEQLLRWNRLLNPSEHAALLGGSMIDLAAGPFELASEDALPPGWPDFDDAPAAPSNLTVSADISPVLSWLSNSVNEENFVIERSDDGDAFAVIGYASRHECTFTDSSYFGISSSYRIYRVKATNAFGDSAYSNEVEADRIHPEGDNYTFSLGNDFYLKNSDTGNWHTVTFHSTGPTFVISSATPGPLTPAVVINPYPGGFSNYSFGYAHRMLLVDQNLSDFREFWCASGTLEYDTDPTDFQQGGAHTPGNYYRFADDLFQIYDIDDQVWRTPYIVGAAGFEQLEFS